METQKIAENIAALERKLAGTDNKTAQDSLRKKIERLKADLQGAPLSAKQLADKLLKAKQKIKQLSTSDFKELIRRLSKKPEYSFLKSMSTSEIKDDLERPAKPVGWRFKGKGDYRKPSARQVREGKANGTVYYENRRMRSDVSKVAQLGTGGGVSDSDFERDYKKVKKHIEDGYGSIDSDYVETTWENLSDITYSAIEDKLIKRLSKDNLLNYAKGGQLKGNQKKLDLNKNGKLDAEDFKMLRSNKMKTGGGVQSFKKGDKVKTRDGKIETILRKNKNGNYETEENDYTHNPADLILVSKMKTGGALKPVPADNKGLPKLPKEVRNKMGYMATGGGLKGNQTMKTKTIISYDSKQVTPEVKSLQEKIIEIVKNNPFLRNLTEYDKKINKINYFTGSQYTEIEAAGGIYASWMDLSKGSYDKEPNVKKDWEKLNSLKEEIDEEIKNHNLKAFETLFPQWFKEISSKYELVNFSNERDYNIVIKTKYAGGLDYESAEKEKEIIEDIRNSAPVEFKQKISGQIGKELTLAFYKKEKPKMKTDVGVDLISYDIKSNIEEKWDTIETITSDIKNFLIAAEDNVGKELSDEVIEAIQKGITQYTNSK